MNTLTMIAERGMSLALAVEMGRTLAERKGCAVYVVRQSDGYRAAMFCDDCPKAVVAVVGASGVLWLDA